MDATSVVTETAREPAPPVYFPAPWQKPVPTTEFKAPDVLERHIQYDFGHKHQRDLPPAPVRELVYHAYDWTLGADVLALVMAFYGEPCSIQTDSCDWNTEACVTCKKFVCVQHRSVCELCGRYTCSVCHLEQGRSLVIMQHCPDHPRVVVSVCTCNDCIEGKHDRRCRVTAIGCNGHHPPPFEQPARCEGCKVIMCVRHGARRRCNKCK